MCSGILAPEQAMPWVDWKWCAEIESFPCSLISERHVGVLNLGDITAADFTKRAAPVDLLIAGTPCQAFSVAGLRKSLSDNRGNLTLRFMEVVHELRPRFTVWENVPGVLSTGDNAFGCLLAGLVGADEAIAPPAGWSSAGVVSGPLGTAAWRILDAQYFGLAQRRARLFLVFCFGDSADPAEILFEFEGMRRDSPPSRTAGEGFAVCPTLRAGGNSTGGDRPPGTDVDTADSLIPMAPWLPQGFAASHVPAMALAIRGRDGVPQMEMGDEVANAILTPTGGRGGIGVGATLHGMAVRRLTPLECERLQGFPDGYTAVEHNRKPAADGPRYKALGNSMAVPVLAWIGRRICEIFPKS